MHTHTHTFDSFHSEFSNKFGFFSIVKGLANAMMYIWEIILLYSLRLVVLIGLVSISNTNFFIIHVYCKHPNKTTK